MKSRGKRGQRLSSANLGRYPFAALLPMYIGSKAAYYAPGTVAEDGRKLRYFARVLRQLKNAGEIVTTNPRHMGREDIEAFLRWMMAAGLSESTRAKYLNTLQRFLEWADNDVVRDMKADRRLYIPRGHYTESPIRSLEPEELQTIIDAAESIEGWRGIVLRGYIALAFGTGCRPKEIIGAHIEDVDIRDMKFYVRHPKGEGSWGKEEWIPIIRDDMLPWIEELMGARRTIEGPMPISQYLFVNPSTGRPYTGNGIRTMKRQTEDATGIRWALKDLRSSLTSITIADDVGKLKSVSLQLRHSSVATTERYYARIDKDKAIRRSIGNEWTKSPISRHKSNDRK